MTNQKNQMRAGLVDGLPASFDTNHIIARKMECGLCDKRLTRNEIETNALIYTDEFEFCHKECISAKKLEYRHLRPKDSCSPVVLLRKKGKLVKSAS